MVDKLGPGAVQGSARHRAGFHLLLTAMVARWMLGKRETGERNLVLLKDLAKRAPVGAFCFIPGWFLTDGPWLFAPVSNLF
jgi:hypothetical protein